jgi:hypothetical protein
LPRCNAAWRRAPFRREGRLKQPAADREGIECGRQDEFGKLTVAFRAVRVAQSQFQLQPESNEQVPQFMPPTECRRSGVVFSNRCRRAIELELAFSPRHRDGSGDSNARAILAHNGCPLPYDQLFGRRRAFGRSVHARQHNYQCTRQRHKSLASNPISMVDLDQCRV